MYQFYFLVSAVGHFLFGPIGVGGVPSVVDYRLPVLSIGTYSIINRGAALTHSRGPRGQGDMLYWLRYHGPVLYIPLPYYVSARYHWSMGSGLAC